MAPEVPQPVAFKSRGNSLSWMDRSIGESSLHSSRKLEASPAAKAKVKGQLIGSQTPGSLNRSAVDDAPTPRALFSQPSAPASPRTVFSPPASICSTPSPRPAQDVDYEFLDDLQRHRATGILSPGGSGLQSPRATLQRCKSSGHAQFRTPTRTHSRMKSMGSAYEGRNLSFFSPDAAMEGISPDGVRRRRKSCSEMDSITGNGAFSVSSSLPDEGAALQGASPRPIASRRASRRFSNLSPLSETEPVPQSVHAVESRRLSRRWSSLMTDDMSTELLASKDEGLQTRSAAATEVAQRCIREYLQTLQADRQAPESPARATSATVSPRRAQLARAKSLVERSNLSYKPPDPWDLDDSADPACSSACFNSPARNPRSLQRANSGGESLLALQRIRAVLRVEVPDSGDDTKDKTPTSTPVKSCLTTPRFTRRPSGS